MAEAEREVFQISYQTPSQHVAAVHVTPFSLLTKFPENEVTQQMRFNPLTPLSDRDRNSPYKSTTISTRYMMRIKKNINLRMIS